MSDIFDPAFAPKTEPESIVAGSFTQWRRDIPYSPAEYTASYRFIPVNGGSQYTLSGSKPDDYWLFVASSVATAAWLSGTYRWDLLVTRLADSETSIVLTGSILVHASTSERRTHAEIMIVKIESILSGRADNDIESYSIKSRSLTRMTVKELTQWRDYYLDEVGRTGGSSTVGRADRNTVYVRFVR